ncbi:putative RNA methylase [Mucilaginibacter sp. UYNi724]
MDTEVSTNFIGLLERATRTIIDEPDNLGGIYKVIHELHTVYAEQSGVAAGDITDDDIMLPSGKAVSTIKAAHCLLEFQRTAVFIRGIYKAVCKIKADFPSETIHILYAGCGPYATLLTPLVALFNHTEIAFTFLDINGASLNAVNRMYDGLNLSEYVKEYVCADATTYNIPDGTTVHLAVSETMLNALMKEPQVAVMQNLIPQLLPKALFVPAKITVSANLLDMNEEQRSKTTKISPRRMALGEVYTISKAHYATPKPVTFSIPDEVDSFKSIFLHTRIETYGGEVLTDYQCSLTNPKMITSMGEMEGKRITFNYLNGETPGFTYLWG